MDPFQSFASYPSRVLGAEHRVCAVAGADRATLQALLQSPLHAFMKAMAPELDDCENILSQLQRHGAMSVAEILAGTPTARCDRVERGLVWLAKLHLLSIEPPAAQALGEGARAPAHSGGNDVVPP